MGKLRLSTFLPGHGKAPSAINPSFVADRTLVGIRENLAEHVERIDTRLDSEQPPQAKAETASPESWPILTRRKPEKDLPFIPSTDVRKRDGREDGRLWIVVDGVVLDVTEYQKKHPGGRSIISGFGGQDCSWQWWSFHRREIWDTIAAGLRVGRTEGIQNPFERPPPIVGLRKFGFQDWD